MSGKAGPGTPRIPNAGARLHALRIAAPLLVLLAIGLSLRVLLGFVYQPAVLNQFDSATYVMQAQGELFGSFYAAPGYSLFLRLAHLLGDDLTLTIAFQHLLGVLTAVLLWWGLYRVTGSRWPGLLPAGVVLLSGDALFMEHTIASEGPFTLLLAAAVVAALLASRGERPWRWLVASGLLLGMAIWVRYVAVALIPVLALWALVLFWRRSRRGLPAAAALAGPAIGMVALLALLQGAQTGSYTLSEASGWGLYSRVAQFADCNEFDPPGGTESLCGATAPPSRERPDFYAWDPRSPARQLYGSPPQGDAQLGAWARRAILAQPLDYAATVLGDASQFVLPHGSADSPRLLLGPSSISFRLRTPDEHCATGECTTPPAGIEEANLSALTKPAGSAYYDGFQPSLEEGVELFQGYQPLVRVSGPLLGAFLAISLLGLLGMSGRLAAAQWLLTGAGIALPLFAAATSTYNVRYGLPAAPLLAAAAGLTIYAIVRGAFALPSWLRPRQADRGEYSATSEHNAPRPAGEPR